MTSIDVELTRWRETGLLLPLVVRLHKVATLEKRIVERRSGALLPDDLACVTAVLHTLFAATPDE